LGGGDVIAYSDGMGSRVLHFSKNLIIIITIIIRRRRRTGPEKNI